MGNVIPLFGDPPPAAEADQDVASFVEEYDLGDIGSIIGAMYGDITAEEFFDFARQVQDKVAAWVVPEPGS